MYAFGFQEVISLNILNVALQEHDVNDSWNKLISKKLQGFKELET